MKLNPIQQLVAKHYCNGEFSNITDDDQLEDCGDDLFIFVLNEVGDHRHCEGVGMARRRIQTAINELVALRNAFDLEEIK